MLRHSVFRFTFAACAAASLAGCSADEAANAEADGSAARASPPIIKQRQENFEAIGIAFKAIRRQLEEGAPDAAVIAAKAAEISHRARVIPDHFPALTGADQGHDTQALPVIWTKPEEFKASAAKLAAASARLALLAEAGNTPDIAAQVLAVGETCKGCHSQFRRAETK